MNPDNWERFDPEKIGVYSDLPPETIKYFQQCFSEGKRPLMWVYVPHILYRGTLNIRDLERIEV